MELYERIKKRREELNMSQEDLANKMGYKSRSSINKIELGKCDIPQSKIAAFAKALDTTPGELMGLNSIDYTIYNDGVRLLAEYSELPKSLCKNYLKLNSRGRIEAEKRVYELTQIPLYSSEPLVNAAHEIPGSSEEDKAHDEEIMNADDWDD